VSIENGSRVLTSHWVETQKGETPFIFKATREMSPNIFINVTLLQSHNQTLNDLPIRLYGIIPIKVEDPQTKLNPQIAMAETLRPGSPVNIKISEATGKAMTYTIAVVDDGLLDLTRFKTPDPWSSFYAREALGVKTWDLYDEVVGAFGGQLERLLAIGGDDAILGPESTKANRFRPVVKYMGPFYLREGRTMEHSFVMPQYIGSVRTMVIAGDQGAYGFAEKTIPVKQELMVLGTLPRVLGPDETVRLPINVFSADASIRQVKVEIKTNDLFTIQGTHSKTIAFSGEGDQLVEFNLKIKPSLGVGKVQISAASGNFKAENTIEIQVRNPNPPVVDVQDIIIEPNKKHEFSFVPVGMEGTNSGILEVSNIPPINLGRRLKFLLSYPHGCVEQTISAVFPQLFVSNIKETTPGEEKMMDGNIKSGIDRLRTFQTTDGGLAYWPGDREASPWGSNYGGHFLLEAEAKGYHVPSNLMNNWVKYQRQEANKWRPNSKFNRDDLVQAYRLYTLALAKKPELGAMNRMRELKDLSVQARWQLAAAYALAGQTEAAREIVRNSSFTIEEYKELAHTYGTPLRDKAMILETLTLLDERVKGMELMKEISSRLSDNGLWMSTQTTAYCLIAVSRFAGKADRTSRMSFAYQLNNGKAVNATTELPIAQVPLEINFTGNGKTMVENKTTGILFARLILEGIPAKGDTSSAENSLMVDVIYKDMDGKLLDPINLPQGTDFMAEVTVVNPGLRGNYQEMALTQIFPSGWEIHNTRFDETQAFYQKDKPDYLDIRDDRVYTYFGLRANQRKTFRVLLNASYAGEYYLPTIYCEAMYDNSINARKPGKWVNVVKEMGGI
jgi:alpha-2-macroglobulin